MHVSCGILPHIGSRQARPFSAMHGSKMAHHLRNVCARLAATGRPLSLPRRATKRGQRAGLSRTTRDAARAAAAGCSRPRRRPAAFKQYGPFNPYIPIRSTTFGKSRVAIDPIAMHTSWRSNSDITSVTSIGYPRMSASGESSTTMHRLLHSSGSHPIPPPNDTNSKTAAPPLKPHARPPPTAAPPSSVRSVIGLVSITATRSFRPCQNPSDLIVQIDGGILIPVVYLIDDLPPPTVLSAGFLVKLVGARRLDASKKLYLDPVALDRMTTDISYNMVKSHQYEGATDPLVCCSPFHFGPSVIFAINPKV
ncbi:hypothetical protein F511_35481 [Dorcoceras hygrometricum]|uniref:Uncharacterized protein n=1 Tax=Dorcoceras hygrometricum TaxID=472368 RepID=A0A2Z7C4F3_9LAMI|nr:hypothetical protein F511_35481 [Dorcoceras hygrometricum]